MVGIILTLFVLLLLEDTAAAPCTDFPHGVLLRCFTNAELPTSPSAYPVRNEHHNADAVHQVPTQHVRPAVHFWLSSGDFSLRNSRRSLAALGIRR